jgi:hypothetical protein
MIDIIQPRFVPKMTVANVLEAIKYAMQREHAREVKEKMVEAYVFDGVAFAE